MRKLRLLPMAVCLFLIATARPASAACVNKFLRRSEGPRQVMTFLTGKLTFQEAQTLAAAINSKQAPPIEWVDEKGKTIAKQFGEMKVVRPMPVGCDGKTSGVVVIVTFPSPSQPSKKMIVKMDANTTVTFEEQTE